MPIRTRTLAPFRFSRFDAARPAALALAALLCGCAGLDGLNYPQGGYDTGYDRRYDGGYYDYDRERERSRRERRELERERERLEDERERLERERERAEEVRRRPPPQPREEKCASGFRESDRKCSPEERKRGCKDIRMPGGKLCVKR